MQKLTSRGFFLEFLDEAGPGDFLHVSPYVPHQESESRDGTDSSLHSRL